MSTLQFLTKFTQIWYIRTCITTFFELFSIQFYNKTMEKVLKSIFLTHKTFVMISDPIEIDLTDFDRIKGLVATQNSALLGNIFAKS